MSSIEESTVEVVFPVVTDDEGVVELSESKVLNRREFDGPHAEVIVSGNLEKSKEYGNKAGIYVCVKLPCYPDEVDEARRVGTQIVHSHLNEHAPTLDKAVRYLLKTRRKRR